MAQTSDYQHSGSNLDHQDAILSNYMAKLEANGITIDYSAGIETTTTTTDNTSGDTVYFGGQLPGSGQWVSPPIVTPLTPPTWPNPNIVIGPGTLPRPLTPGIGSFDISRECGLCQKNIDPFSSQGISTDLCGDCEQVIPTTKDLVLIIGKLLATVALGAEEDEEAIAAARAMIARLSTKELIRDELKEEADVD